MTWLRPFAPIKSSHVQNVFKHLLQLDNDQLMSEKKENISGSGKCILVDPRYGFGMDNGESPFIIPLHYIYSTFAELLWFPYYQ